MSSIEGWIEKSDYDLDTARAMMATGRYLYVLFCCQQTLEKALKALVAKKTHEFPPRLHSLMRLAELLDLEMTEDQSLLFRDLSVYYIQTRYSETMRQLSEKITKSVAQEFLDKTEEAHRWICSMI